MKRPIKPKTPYKKFERSISLYAFYLKLDIKDRKTIENQVEIIKNNIRQDYISLTYISSHLSPHVRELIDFINKCSDTLIVKDILLKKNYYNAYEVYFGCIDLEEKRKYEAKFQQYQELMKRYEIEEKLYKLYLAQKKLTELQESMLVDRELEN